MLKTVKWIFYKDFESSMLYNIFANNRYLYIIYEKKLRIYIHSQGVNIMETFYNIVRSIICGEGQDSMCLFFLFIARF